MVAGVMRRGQEPRTSVIDLEMAEETLQEIDREAVAADFAVHASALVVPPSSLHAAARVARASGRVKASLVMSDPLGTEVEGQGRSAAPKRPVTRRRTCQPG